MIKREWMPLIFGLIIIGIDICIQIIMRIICNIKLKKKVKEINEKIKDNLIFYDEKEKTNDN